MMTYALLQWDANGDGKLTKAEFDKAQHAAFDKIDTNKDGSATPEELEAARKVERQEHAAAMAKARFAELDKDKNGQVSLSEFQTAEALRFADRPDGRRGESRFGPGGPGGPGGPPMFARRMMGFGPGAGPGGPGPLNGPMMRGGPGGLRGGPPNGQQAANQVQPRRAGPADADGDGKLTFSEFNARATEAFSQADTNKDGVVTIAELQALPNSRP
jgi:Ca2+-binding EF-hand superfamily protein